MESSLGFVKVHCTAGVSVSLLTGIHMHSSWYNFNHQDYIYE